MNRVDKKNIAVGKLDVIIGENACHNLQGVIPSKIVIAVQNGNYISSRSLDAHVKRIGNALVWTGYKPMYLLTSGGTATSAASVRVAVI
jgi:hypothetical protein